VEVELSRHAEFVQITVRDNGQGISLEVQKDIFVPFFTTKKEGSGIGLSLSKQIMKAHGGDITMRTLRQGVEFVVIL